MSRNAFTHVHIHVAGCMKPTSISRLWRRDTRLLYRGEMREQQARNAADKGRRNEHGA
jgi:hypothetical protein